MTTGKRTERTKHDFRYPICRSAIGQPFLFLRAPSSTDVPVLLLNQPSIIYERYRFNNRSQEKQNQSIHTWLLCELLPKPANLESWKTIFSATELCVESEKMLLEGKYCKNLGCLCQTVWISTKPRKLHHQSSKKEIVYWPGMPAKIRDYISKREVYTSCKKEQRKEPLVSHNTPSHPWEIVGSDIVQFDNNTSVLWITTQATLRSTLSKTRLLEKSSVP